jgi:hypothetical protein
MQHQLAAAVPRVTAYGATLSVLRVPAKVPSPSDLPTFVIVHLGGLFNYRLCPGKPPEGLGGGAERSKLHSPGAPVFLPPRLCGSRRGTKSSNPVPSSGESSNLRFLGDATARRLGDLRPAGGRVAAPAPGENRAPPSGSASETNNECQIKFELLQMSIRPLSISVIFKRTTSETRSPAA